MSLAVSDLYPLLYSQNVDLAVQQLKSKLQTNVTNAIVDGERKGFNLLNKRAVTNVATNSRKQATPDNDADFERYWLIKTMSELVETHDERDDKFLGTITLPTSEEVMSFAASMNREIDQKIIDAATGTRYIGASGGTSDALPAGQIIAVNYVASGTAVTSGLTVDKIRQAAYLFDAADVPEGDRVFVMSAKAKQNLLATTEATSDDYNTVRALVNGTIDTFYGFTFVMSNRLDLTSTVRTCIAFHKSGIKLAADPVSTYMDVLPTKRHALQVRSTMLAGAVRTENTKVVSILCSEA